MPNHISRNWFDLVPTAQVVSAFVCTLKFGQSRLTRLFWFLKRREVHYVLTILLWRPAGFCALAARWNCHSSLDNFVVLPILYKIR